MSLEDKVNGKQSEGLIKKTLKLGYNATLAGAATVLSTSFVGTTGIFVGGALAAGSAIGSAIKGGKTLYNHVVDSLKTYASANIFITPALKVWDYTMPFIPGNGLGGFVARGIYACTAFNAYFTALAAGTRHLVDHYFNPFGIIKSISDNYYNHFKRNAIGFAPAYTLAANGLTQIAGIPTFAYNALGLSAYNQLNQIPNKDKSEQPAPKYENKLPEKKPNQLAPNYGNNLAPQMAH